MRTTLTYRTALLFFLPLIFMTELHQISHSVVHAFLARLDDPTLALAAFTVAFTFNTTLSGVISTGIQAGISFIHSRADFWRLYWFFFLMGLVPFVIIEWVAFTHWGDVLYGRLMGASPEVVKQARVASAVMGLWILPNNFRNLGFALCMVHRRTMLISYATVLRLGALAFFLWLFPFFLEGAVVGAAAMVSCMTVETVFVLRFSRRFYRALPAQSTEPPGTRELWRFSWPLMFVQITENGVTLILNFFLGRLVNPDLALASFGVVYGLVRVLLAPVRNLVQTAQALVYSETDVRVMMWFTFSVVSFFAGLVFVLFHDPVLRAWALVTVMGLPADVTAYITPAVQITFLVAIFWGYAAVFRGLLSAMRRTGVLAATAVVRFCMVVAVGSITLLLPGLNGAVVGVLAMTGAFWAETLLLCARLWRSRADTEPVFPQRDPAAPGPAH